MSRTFIFILLMLLPLTSRSQTVEWEGVVYEIDTTIGEAKVVKVTNITQKDGRRGLVGCSPWGR